MKKYLIIPVLCLIVGYNAAGQHYSEIKTPMEEKMEVLPLNSVKPAGWLKDQIRENLNGFVGHLDQLAPDLIIEDDIYNKDRLSKNSKAKELGALGEGGDWQIQLFWWNSETQSNWRDGYIRSAILANDKLHLEQIEKYVHTILKNQDKDGYLGIYDSELRYNFDNENGELWAKASLLRGILAWYDYTKDEKILAAVKMAVQNTMDNFPMDASHPFYTKNPNVGGLSHGLTFTDVLEQLFYITKDRKYLNYALFLYTDFSEQTINEDAQLKRLLDKEEKLFGHGVHTYEHLRCLAAAYYASGNETLLQALKNFESKIGTTTTVSGGPVGDEWIGKRPADATNRGYEYCSTHEILHSYASLLAKTADKSYADKIEHLFFNAAQGARHPEKSCIAYLKSDNSYEMSGGLNGDTHDAKQTRYRYSPVHKEAAVCCVPNAGRIAPYYVQYMWQKDADGLVASLLGPSVLETTVNEKKVIITQQTDYPFENKITFVINTRNNLFTLKIRKPEWAEKIKVNMPFTEKNGFITIDKRWQNNDKIVVEFLPEVELKTDNIGDFYFQYGSLLLAKEIEAVETVTKTYPIKGFADLSHKPVDLAIYEYVPDQKIVQNGHLKFETRLFNTKTKRLETIILKPFGKTILRQTTFKKHP